MNFAVDESTRELLSRIREIVDRDIVPLEPRFLAGGMVEVEADLARIRRRLRDERLFGPQLPEELGGVGLSLVEHGMVSEVLGRSPLGHYAFGCQAPDAGNIEILFRHGTEEQKERWLAPLAAGELRSCFAMTEPQTAGSNPTSLTCRARSDGDDYVLDGDKWFTTAADGAAFAIVMAVTDPHAPKHRRATQILVPTDTPGFERVRNIPVMGHEGDGWASHAEIRLRGCRVPKKNRIGDEGAGFVIAQERLGPGRIHHCMRWIGICERAFDLMCRRAATRELAPGELLGDRQIVQAWIAESRAAIDAARLTVLHAAWKADAEGFAAARQEISLIKFSVAATMMEVVDRAIQVHGALGVTSDLVLSFFYAQERGARIYDGPDEVHKMVVARRILDRYREEAGR